MHDQQPGTSAFTAVGAPQLNTVTNLPEVRPPTGTPRTSHLARLLDRFVRKRARTASAGAGMTAS